MTECDWHGCHGPASTTRTVYGMLRHVCDKHAGGELQDPRPPVPQPICESAWYPVERLDELHLDGFNVAAVLLRNFIVHEFAGARWVRGVDLISSLMRIGNEPTASSLPF